MPGAPGQGSGGRRQEMGPVWVGRRGACRGCAPTGDANSSSRQRAKEDREIHADRDGGEYFELKT